MKIAIMKGLFVLLSCFLLTGIAVAQPVKGYHPNSNLLKQANHFFTEAVSQYKLLAGKLPADKFPKTYFPDSKQYEFSNSSWWCSGFYPGTLLMLYRQTGDPFLYGEAIRMLGVLEKEQFNTHTHDLGFMMYCSFGNALVQKDNPSYRQVLVNSAKSLSTRFNPRVGCIKSWDGKPNEFLVIIDNMMNLDLLFWATRETGDSSFYKIAVTHANTTMANHFRPDHSSYHVINYNQTDGSIIQKKTAQGFADESAWARGQSWGLYGYTATYRQTRDPKYLKQATDIADFLLSHPNLPADKIPYWDYNAADIPHSLRDASAASIMASALIELSHYVSKSQAKKYLQVAEKILLTLSDRHYRASAGTNGGFILQHSVGHKPAGTEIDVPLTYADYYYIEALERYLALADTRQK